MLTSPVLFFLFLQVSPAKKNKHTFHEENHETTILQAIFDIRILHTAVVQYSQVRWQLIKKKATGNHLQPVLQFQSIQFRHGPFQVKCKDITNDDAF